MNVTSMNPLAANAFYMTAFRWLLSGAGKVVEDRPIPIPSKLS